MMELAIWYPDSIPAILLTMFTPRFTDRMQESNHPQSQDNTPQRLPPGHQPHFFLGLRLIPILQRRGAVTAVAAVHVPKRRDADEAGVSRKPQRRQGASYWAV